MSTTFSFPFSGSANAQTSPDTARRDGRSHNFMKIYEKYKLCIITSWGQLFLTTFHQDASNSVHIKIKASIQQFFQELCYEYVETRARTR